MYNIIPLTPDPDQNFSCSIPLQDSNLLLYFRIRFNTIANYWTMMVSDSRGNIFLDSVPLVTGVNLLNQVPYLGIGSAAVIKVSESELDFPDSEALGTDFVLMWGDAVE